MKNLKRRLSEKEDRDDEDKGKKGGKEEKKRGYDPDKDKVIKEVGTIEVDSAREGNIIVRIASYNDGPKKIAVMRRGENKEGEPWYTARLGRITKEQAKKLRILLKKADKYI